MPRRTRWSFVLAAGVITAPMSTLAASPSPVATASSVAPGTQPVCQNPYGGVCLGPLAAGTYTTRLFETPITYRVPDGWANHEDLPGNVLLMPPGATLEGGDAGTSDYIGIFQGVAVAQGDCESRAEPGVGTTAVEMAAALGERPGLAVSEPIEIEVGGLSGMMIDITLDGSGTGCAVPDFPGTLVPLFIGAGPASVEHAQIDGISTRLYLLDHGASNIVIEVSDVSSGPATMADLIPVVEALEFAP